jgi:hypothetical protein
LHRSKPQRTLTSTPTIAGASSYPSCS